MHRGSPEKSGRVRHDRARMRNRCRRHLASDGGGFGRGRADPPNPLGTTKLGSKSHQMAAILARARWLQMFGPGPAGFRARSLARSCEAPAGERWRPAPTQDVGGPGEADYVGEAARQVGRYSSLNVARSGQRALLALWKGWPTLEPTSPHTWPKGGGRCVAGVGVVFATSGGPAVSETKLAWSQTWAWCVSGGQLSAPRCVVVRSSADRMWRNGAHRFIVGQTKVRCGSIRGSRRPEVRSAGVVADASRHAHDTQRVPEFGLDFDQVSASSEFGQICPRFAPNTCALAAELGQRFVRLRPDLHASAESRPISGRFRLRARVCAKVWGDVGRSWGISPEVGPTWATLGVDLADLSEFRPNLAQLRPSWVIWVGFGPAWAKIHYESHARPKTLDQVQRPERSAQEGVVEMRAPRGKLTSFATPLEHPFPRCFGPLS